MVLRTFRRWVALQSLPPHPVSLGSSTFSADSTTSALAMSWRASDSVEDSALRLTSVRRRGGTRSYFRKDEGLAAQRSRSVGIVCIYYKAAASRHCLTASRHQSMAQRATGTPVRLSRSGRIMHTA
ncbi:hypothetical protein MRX96_008904 [Rhipicephalus microplus]